MENTIRDFIIGMPKAENHIHIEGSIPWQTALEISRKHSIPLPADNETDLKAWALEIIAGDNLNGFMKCDRTINAVCQDEEDYEKVVLALAKADAEQNIIYQELHLDYPLNEERGIPLEVVMEGYRSGKKKALELYGVDICYIAGLDRTLSSDACVRFVRSLERYLDMVDGLGMDCEERGYPCRLHKDSYDLAREMGLYVTAHAGEDGPAENIWDALRILKCSRIDHGTHAWQDPALMEYLRDHDILLAMCPYGNTLLGAADGFERHPFRQYLDAGIPVSISSDDPPYTLSLTDEWLLDAEKMDMSLDEAEKVARNAFAYSIKGRKHLHSFEAYCRAFRKERGL